MGMIFVFSLDFHNVSKFKKLKCLQEEKTMFKKKYFIVLFFVSTFSNLNSQPYYYTSTYEPIAGLSKYKGSIYRINISNPTIVDTLIPNVSELVSVSSDEFGNWVSYGDNDLLTILSINNLVHRNVISNNSEGIIKFSYAGAINKLVVLYESDDYPNPRKLVIVNPETLTITDSIPYDIYRRCFTSQDISFSKSGDVMYLLRGDSVLLKPTIISYSLSSKQLIKTKYIEELSYTGSNEFYFDFRRNGLGVIESWFESPNSTSYYRIYFLDHDSLSITIQRDESQTWGNAYIASNGNYLLTFKSVVPDSVNISPLTGEIDIYNMVNGEIKKTIQLPSDGEVMCFENYPNNVYYVKDIELPTRQVWNLDMDSIFNEIDLESLDPDTVDINSPTLALTIKGIGFDSVSTVYFNGQERLTTFVSDSVLIAEILASDLSVAGSYPVWVTDTWGVSDTLQFVVKAPIVIAADINVINPAMSLVNPGTFTMEIKGTGFTTNQLFTLMVMQEPQRLFQTAH